MKAKDTFSRKNLKIHKTRHSTSGDGSQGPLRSLDLDSRSVLSPSHHRGGGRPGLSTALPRRLYTHVPQANLKGNPGRKPSSPTSAGDTESPRDRKNSHRGGRGRAARSRGWDERPRDLELPPPRGPRLWASASTRDRTWGGRKGRTWSRT